MIEHLLAGQPLSESQAATLLTTLTDPSAPDVKKAGLLVALRAKGETATELRGMARALRDAAVPVDLGDVVDTAGTGGDGKGTVNISTAASLVVAATGERVAKHGNRSVSSRSGSADVLEALGVRIPQHADQARDQLDRTGFTFLFAPTFHPAMAAVRDVRRGMGIRTAFNLLGPLVNPARPHTQLIGAYSEEAAAQLAHAAAGLVPRATVVHGLSGHDEATPIGPYVAYQVVGLSVRREVVDPEPRYGIPRCAPDALQGGDAAQNAEILDAVFRGARGPVRDAVCLNAALLLELRGVTHPVARAQEALDTGAVTSLVEALRD